MGAPPPAAAAAQDACKNSSLVATRSWARVLTRSDYAFARTGGLLVAVFLVAGPWGLPLETVLWRLGAGVRDPVGDASLGQRHD